MDFVKKKIFPKKQAEAGAGFFRQMPNSNIYAAKRLQLMQKLENEEAIKVLDELEQMKRLFVSCSGMQNYLKYVEKLQDGTCDEVILLALMNGAKITLEDFCSTLNNNAVYASLFLSSTLGFLFDPPDVVASLPNDSVNKTIYFLGIIVSITCNIINVLCAVIVFAAKNKLLRESDALGYLQKIRNASVESGTVLTIGILGMVFSIIPVIIETYGRVALFLFTVCGVALVVYALMQRDRYVARHCKYYYMEKGDKNKKKSKVHHKKKPSARHIRVRAAPSPREADSQVSSALPEDHNADQHGFDNNDANSDVDVDPYDPTIALYSYAKLAHVGQMLSTHDSDASGVVTIDELVKLADTREKEIIQEIAESEKQSG